MLYPPAATSPLACPCGLPDGGRFVPFCVPDDPQSHINKGCGSSIRGCYALYLHGARVAHEMRKDPAVFSFYLSFSHFVKLQILQFTYRFRATNLQQITRQIMQQITMQTRQIIASASRAYLYPFISCWFICLISCSFLKINFDYLNHINKAIW